MKKASSPNLKKSTTTSSSNNTNISAGINLTLEQLLASIPTASIKDPKNTLEKHSLSGKHILSLPPSGLAFFSSLRQLDLSDNLITDISPLSHMPSLRHLNISKNNISDLSPLQTVCSSITVLDVSGQKNKKLTSLASLLVSSSSPTTSARKLDNDSTEEDTFKTTNMKKKKFNSHQQQKSSQIVYANLKTIIATDNDLRSLFNVAENSIAKNTAVPPFPILDTLVLSRNPNLGTYKTITNKTREPFPHHQQSEDGDEDQQQLQQNDQQNNNSNSNSYYTRHWVDESDLWSSISLLVSSTIRKISLSDCGVEGSLPCDLDLHLVHELRLAKNKIQFFPHTIRLKSLQILDVSHNQFESFDSIGRFPFLKHLSVQGNPYLLHTNIHGDTKASSDDVGAHKNKSIAKQMKEFLAFLYLFLKDLQTVDGKKFDRNVVRTGLDRVTCRRVKVRVTRKIKQGVGLVGGDDDDDEEDENDQEEQEHRNEDDRLGHEDAAEENNTEERTHPRIGNFNDDQEDEQDDDGANDPTIMLRRRRRREEDGDDNDDDQNRSPNNSASSSKKQTKEVGIINSDDEEAIDADEFLKGSTVSNKPSSANQLAAKAIVSIKRRPTLAAKQQQQQQSNNSNNNKNSGRNASSSKQQKASASAATPSKVIDAKALLLKAAQNSKQISQW